MLRLAHISDVHLGPLPAVKRRELISKRITGYANWRLNRKGDMGNQYLEKLIDHMHAAAPDHIAVTGDLVNLALPEELRLARAWLDALGSPDHVSAIPGNHDTYVPGALAEITRLWRPFMSGDNDDGASNPFPYLRKRDHVALIGTNSGRATMPFMATGSFQSRQAEGTAKLLREMKDDGKFRVVMIHHPPFEGATVWSKRLIGSARFRKVISEHGAELVLHGHTHIVSQEEIAGPDGPVPVIGVPSASMAPRRPNNHGAFKGRPGGRYNLFSISGAPGNWSCRMEEFGYRDGSDTVEFIEARDLYPRLSEVA